MNGVRNITYLNQSRTWHITAYIWEEMSIASDDDLITEWIAVSAVWCRKASLVDQTCRFYSDSPIEMNPLLEVTAYGAYVIARLACCNLKRHVCTCGTLKAWKINYYFWFHFNKWEENYWLTLTVHLEDGSSRFIRSYHHQPTALHEANTSRTIHLGNYGFAFFCLRIIRW